MKFLAKVGVLLAVAVLWGCFVISLNLPLPLAFMISFAGGAVLVYFSLYLLWKIMK